MLTKVNDVIVQCLWRHSCQFKSQKFSSFLLPVKQMFRTWMKTLLHCGYKYLLNLLVTLVVTYSKKG